MLDTHTACTIKYPNQKSFTKTSTSMPTHLIHKTHIINAHQREHPLTRTTKLSITIIQAIHHCKSIPPNFPEVKAPNRFYRYQLLKIKNFICSTIYALTYPIKICPTQIWINKFFWLSWFIINFFRENLITFSDQTWENNRIPAILFKGLKNH